MKSYQKKYIECIKIYHQLYAEVLNLTINVVHEIKAMNMPAKHKSILNDVIFKSSENIKKIDEKLRNLIGSNL